MGQNNRKLLASIMEQAWASEEFRKKLEAHPRQTMKECGLDVPESVEVLFHYNDPYKIHLVLPHKDDS